MKGKFGVWALALAAVVGGVIVFLVAGDKEKIKSIFKKKTQ